MNPELMNEARGILEGKPMPPPAMPKDETQPAEVKDYSREFAALTKKQKDIFAKEKELKEKEAMIKQLEEIEALKEQDPLEYLNKKGLKFDDIVQRALKNGEEPTPEDKISALEKRIESLIKSQEEKEKAKEEEQKRLKLEADEKAIANFKQKIETFVSGDLEKYELINHEGAFDVVFDVIEEQWLKDKTKPLMGIEEAAELVENHFFEKYQKALALKKLGKKVETKSESLDAVETASLPTPTLKSNVTPSASSPSKEHLSFDERMEEAKKLLRANGFR
jgi:hypothetical protein